MPAEEEVRIEKAGNDDTCVHSDELAWVGACRVVVYVDMKHRFHWRVINGAMMKEQCPNVHSYSAWCRSVAGSYESLLDPESELLLLVRVYET